jgi:MarR family transcriptional regulator, organic hydroperoxide resistance regulator
MRQSDFATCYVREVDQDGSARRREQGARILRELQAYSASQSELGRQFARRMGMHPTDSVAVVEILRAEERGDPLTPARLAPRVGLTSGATSILLNRLEDAGHITRRRGHTDRRRVTLHSAATVHAAADEFFAPLSRRLSEVVDEFTPEQLQTVEQFVTAVRGTVDAHVTP